MTSCIEGRLKQDQNLANRKRLKLFSYYAQTHSLRLARFIVNIYPARRKTRDRDRDKQRSTSRVALKSVSWGVARFYTSFRKTAYSPRLRAMPFVDTWGLRAKHQPNNAWPYSC